MSSVETGQMSAVETGQMTAAETSVLSQQKTSVLSQQQILCVSETCSGPDTSKSPYLGNRKVTFQIDGTPPIQNRGAVPMVTVPWRVAEKPEEKKMAPCQDVSCGARPQISKSCRKWAQNGRHWQRLSRQPRGSGRLKTWFADGPGARRGRQRPVPAETDHPGRGTLPQDLDSQ